MDSKGNMRVEGRWCDLDELSLGFSMDYGEDDFGSFHLLEVGLLIFRRSFYKY